MENVFYFFGHNVNISDFRLYILVILNFTIEFTAIDIVESNAFKSL